MWHIEYIYINTIRTDVLDWIARAQRLGPSTPAPSNGNISLWETLFLFLVFYRIQLTGSIRVYGL